MIGVKPPSGLTTLRYPHQIEKNEETHQGTFERGEAYTAKGDHTQAFECYERSADQGNSHAQFNIGMSYLHGIYGVNCKPDPEKALKYLTLSAEQGHRDAMVRLGMTYHSGEINIPKDPKKAFDYFLRSADKGDAFAQDAVGVYLCAQGVAQDFQKARRYFELSVEQNYFTAHFHLGRMYQNGWGVGVDHKLAFAYFKLSADHACIDAKYEVAMSYRNGLGVDKDYSKAFKYFESCTGIGGYVNANAEREVGESYRWGRNVKKDHTKALKHLKISADHGDDEAQLSLGTMHFQGNESAKQNLMEAAKYYVLSAKQGNIDVPPKLKLLVKLLIDKAEKRDNSAFPPLKHIHENQKVPPEYREQVTSLLLREPVKNRK